MDFSIHLKDHLLPCHIKQVTGIDCPGCGFQRACLALCRGDLMQSLELFPALLPMLALGLFLLLHLKFRFSFGPKILLSLFLLSFSLMWINFFVKLSHIL
ncbi:MAG: DUF2752 domain-containing protein [Salibacteraceae bacterium]